MRLLLEDGDVAVLVVMAAGLEIGGGDLGAKYKKYRLCMRRCHPKHGDALNLGLHWAPSARPVIALPRI